MKTKYLAAALLALARTEERSNPLRRRIVRKYLFLLVSLCILSVAAHGQTVDPRLVIYGSLSNSVLVNILNLTPYDMNYFYGSLTDQTNRDRQANQSFMFAPLGVPRLICGAIPIGDTVHSHYLNECKNRPLANSTAPVPFVISWEDQGGLIQETSLAFKLYGVKCESVSLPQADCFGAGYTDDVTLGLWFSRTGPDPSPAGQLFADTMGLIQTAISLIEDPVTISGWVDAFLAVKELADHASDFETWNANQSDGVKMYVYSWPVPRAGSGCSNPGATCQPAVSAIGGSYDWVSVAWPSVGGYQYWAGDAEASLMVVMHVVRGQKPLNDSGVGSHPFAYGSLTTVNITIMRPATLTTASVSTAATTTLPERLRRVLLSNGFGRIREYLLRHGRDGLLALRDIIESLSPTDRQLLLQATQSTLKGELRKEEEQVLRYVAQALETRRP